MQKGKYIELHVLEHKKTTPYGLESANQNDTFQVQAS